MGRRQTTDGALIDKFLTAGRRMKIEDEDRMLSRNGELEYFRDRVK